MVCVSPPLQGQDTAAFTAKMKSGFWPALRMNWRVWTPVQFININYIPVQVRPASCQRGATGGFKLPYSLAFFPSLGSSQVLDSSRGFSLCSELLPLLDLRRQSKTVGPKLGPRCAPSSQAVLSFLGLDAHPHPQPPGLHRLQPKAASPAGTSEPNLSEAGAGSEW